MTDIKIGDVYIIPPMMKHRVTATSITIINEESTLYNDLDIVRLEDQYGRVGTTEV